MPQSSPHFVQPMDFLVKPIPLRSSWKNMFLSHRYYTSVTWMFYYLRWERGKILRDIPRTAIRNTNQGRAAVHFQRHLYNGHWNAVEVVPVLLLVEFLLQLDVICLLLLSNWKVGDPFNISIIFRFHGDMEQTKNVSWTPCLVNGHGYLNSFLFSFTTQTTIGQPAVYSIHY